MLVKVKEIQTTRTLQYNFTLFAVKKKDSVKNYQGFGENDAICIDSGNGKYFNFLEVSVASH